MKRIMALVLLSVLIVTGCSGNDVGTETTGTMELSKEEQEAMEMMDKWSEGIKKDKEENEKKVRDYAEANKNKAIVGDYEDGEMLYILKGYRYQDTFNSHPTGELTTNGKFLILEFHVENIGKTEYYAKPNEW